MKDQEKIKTLEGEVELLKKIIGLQKDLLEAQRNAPYIQFIPYYTPPLDPIQPWYGPTTIETEFTS